MNLKEQLFVQQAPTPLEPNKSQNYCRSQFIKWNVNTIMDFHVTQENILFQMSKKCWFKFLWLQSENWFGETHFLDQFQDLRDCWFDKETPWAIIQRSCSWHNTTWFLKGVVPSKQLKRKGFRFTWSAWIEQLSASWYYNKEAGRSSTHVKKARTALLFRAQDWFWCASLLAVLVRERYLGDSEALLWR